MSETLQDRYLALSGGGFDAHSAHAGWLSGGMDGLAASGRDHDIDQLLGNVRALASSSGGSWFSSMLGYSEAFRSQFESSAARDAYNTSGYNGQLRQIFAGLFNEDGTPRLTPEAQNLLDDIESTLTTTVADTLKAVGVTLDLTPLIDTVRFVAAMTDNTVSQSGLSWRGFVDNYVYRPLGLTRELDGITLASARNPWASDVDVLIGGVMQTSPVVLGSVGSGLTTEYGKVSALPTAPAVPSQLHFTPISLISKAPAQPDGTPVASALFTAGPFQSTYRNLRLGRRKVIQTPIPSSLSNTLSLIDATTVSSASVGVAAGLESLAMGLGVQASLSELLTPLSDQLRRFAPVASISSAGVLGPLPPLPPNSRTLETAAQLGAVRLADSGYVDNSSVGYLLRQIQDVKGTSAPFSITLLMNSTEKPDPITGVHNRVRVGPDDSTLSTFGVTSEVANLFGQSKGDGSLDGDAIAMALIPILDVPSAQLFNEAAWYGRTAPDWSYNQGSISLSYHNLDVTTVENRTFGVKGGQSGELHVFTAFNTDSFAAPLNFGTLDEYAENYDVIRQAVASGGGFPHLQAALGITPSA